MEAIISLVVVLPELPATAIMGFLNTFNQIPPADYASM